MMARNRKIAALKDPVYRHSYVDTHTRMFLTAQIRHLRGNETQEQFAKRIGKPQSVVSRLENPSYSGLTVRTLIDIARKLDLGLLVRFISLSDLVDATADIAAEIEKAVPYKGD